MKKGLMWSAFICLAMVLLFNLGSDHVAGVKSEKEWYLAQLNFEFSGILDSAERPGQVLFHVTHGRIDLEKEATLKQELRFNGLLDLFLYRPDGKMDLMVPQYLSLKQGDSVYVNTDLQVAKFFRKGDEIGEQSLLKSLRGRPF
jgi:hypothetical protein